LARFRSVGSALLATIPLGLMLYLLDATAVGESAVSTSPTAA
jgi:hypothetical protein